MIPRPVFADLQAHARETYPEECCGFLIGRREGDARVVEISRRTPNVHPGQRETQYTIDNRAILAVEHEFRGDTRLVGLYHSHPDHPARPSAFDAERAWPWYAYVILAVVRGEPGDATAWTFDEDRRAFRTVALETV
ncbi:MAG TPA: M67 family metallopeptidase [Thermoplasmata archaeon]|nr:M67 family metallopeptidase [Thermoplasmata archaeon]